MSFSGFATRNQEGAYNKTLASTLEILVEAMVYFTQSTLSTQ
jgi:hypothetical protein